MTKPKEHFDIRFWCRCLPQEGTSISCTIESAFKVHLFETPSGSKFVMLSDPGSKSLRFVFFLSFIPRKRDEEAFRFAPLQLKEQLSPKVTWIFTARVHRISLEALPRYARLRLCLRRRVSLLLRFVHPVSPHTIYCRSFSNSNLDSTVETRNLSPSALLPGAEYTRMAYKAAYLLQGRKLGSFVVHRRSLGGGMIELLSFHPDPRSLRHHNNVYVYVPLRTLLPGVMAMVGAGLRVIWNGSNHVKLAWNFEWNFGINERLVLLGVDSGRSLAWRRAIVAVSITGPTYHSFSRIESESSIAAGKQRLLQK
ncbi:hypothetical protein FB446DRAFT_704244 [Lentinula raphanica]|nr:hypothetical protein FB446DRAFT_704244 [Lentinula raphanica]